MMRRGMPTWGAAIPMQPGEARIVSRRSSMKAVTSGVTASTGADFSLSRGSGNCRMGRMAMTGGFQSSTVSIGRTEMETPISFLIRSNTPSSSRMSTASGMSTSRTMT
jgi:hypothetical protein